MQVFIVTEHFTLQDSLPPVKVASLIVVQEEGTECSVFDFGESLFVLVKRLSALGYWAFLL